MKPRHIFLIVLSIFVLNNLSAMKRSDFSSKSAKSLLSEKDKVVQQSLIKLYPDYFYEHDAFEYIGKIKGDAGVFEFYQNVHARAF